MLTLMVTLTLTPTYTQTLKHTRIMTWGDGGHSISSPLHSQRHAKNSIYLDRWVYANSADSDQTAPAEQSDQVLHCLLFHLPPLSKLLHGMNEPFV